MALVLRIPDSALDQAGGTGLIERGVLVGRRRGRAERAEGQEVEGERGEDVDRRDPDEGGRQEDGVARGFGEGLPGAGHRSEAEVDDAGEGREAERDEEDGERPLQPAQPSPAALRIGRAREIATMRAIKQALDPQGRMNPGKVLEG